MKPSNPGPERSDFRAPLTLAPGNVPGLDTMAELPPDAAVMAWRVLRTALLWASEDPAERGALLDTVPLAAWEERLLTATFEADLRLPLAVVVGELSRGDGASGGRISWACLCVADWALAHRASRTALAFVETAALVSPEHPRYAWVAGRILRTFGRFNDSGQWLRRAVRAARRAGDWEAQARGLNSLGNTFLERGELRDASRFLKLALRTAQRRRLRQHEGENLHDLFVVHFEMGEWAQAEEFARGAFEFYHQLRHDRLPMLVHDVAFLWLSRGYFARALGVLRAVRPLMTHDEDRLRILSSAVRAAGAAGDRELFDELWAESWHLAVEFGRERRYAATALVQMGMGASSLSEWERARTALELAHEMAQARGEADVIHRSEVALAAVRDEQAAETVRRMPSVQNSPGDTLARRMVSSLASGAAAR